ncbi:hypothetical protein [Endozoicomonas sp. YOMI1]|uniref:hypothetical protein n=1 Tax=Endozoicomonas sp. YOMI1 TaxID=2828739 RepID=UPI0021493F5B|nr:hypothetical protein [Endozoicomonas sp. YOMI1]
MHTMINRFKRIFSRLAFLSSGQKPSFDGPGLSRIIADWVEPLLSKHRDNAEIENIIDLTSNCWNIGACPRDKQAELWSLLIQPIVEEHFYEHRHDLRDKLRKLIKVREKLYAHDPRFILDFRFKFRHSQLRLDIFSTRDLSPSQFMAGLDALIHQSELNA